MASSKSFTTTIRMGASAFTVTHLEPSSEMIHVSAARLSDRELSSVASIISELHGLKGCSDPPPRRRDQSRQPRRAPPHVRLSQPPAFVPVLREVTL